MGLFFKSKPALTQEERKNKKLVVKTFLCPQNHPCPSVRVCPVDALSQKGFNAPTVDYTKCVKCGKCVNLCPKRALALE